MYCVSKIDRCRAFWQLYHIARWGEDEYAVTEEVKLHCFSEVRNIFRLLCNLKHLLYPDKTISPAATGVRLVALLVRDHRSHSVLCLRVHLFSSDLNLGHAAVPRIDRGVDALVTIRLGVGYVILHFASDGLPLRVY